MDSQFSTTYHIHISSHHSLWNLNLREVWDYRDLIWLFTKRSFTVTYKQTVLGPLWLLLNPLLTSLIYVVLFGNIARLGTDGIPHLLFYMTSHALWSLFANCLTKNANAFTGNAHIFGKVYFPRLTIPISNILSAIIQFGIQMSLVLLLLAYYLVMGMVHPNYLLWLTIPGILVWMGVLGMGCGIIVSSLTTKYRDLAVLVTFGVQIWLYASPVVYPLSQVSGILRRLILLNPITMPMELFRYAFLGAGQVIPLYVMISLSFTVVVALGGVIIFNKVERTFMDTV